MNQFKPQILFYKKKPPMDGNFLMISNQHLKGLTSTITLNIKFGFWKLALYDYFFEIWWAQKSRYRISLINDLPWIMPPFLKKFSTWKRNIIQSSALLKLLKCLPRICAVTNNPNQKSITLVHWLKSPILVWHKLLV